MLTELRPLLAATIISAHFGAALVAVRLAEASEAQLHPVDGSWHAEFTPVEAPYASTYADSHMTLHGTVRLNTARVKQPWVEIVFAMRPFHGVHDLRFRHVTGDSDADDPHVSASRRGLDSVALDIGKRCEDCSAIHARGRLAGDTITGLWTTSPYGPERTTGRFRMVRDTRSAAQISEDHAVWAATVAHRCPDVNGPRTRAAVRPAGFPGLTNAHQLTMALARALQTEFDLEDDAG